jgi:hypothetical protein
MRVGQSELPSRYVAQEKGVPQICTDNKQICFFVCNGASAARYRGPPRKLDIEVKSGA